MLSTEDEFQTLFKEEETYDPSKYMFEFAAGQCYDHIWVAALALNCTDIYLKEQGIVFFSSLNVDPRSWSGSAS